jgi:hypothetical protein
LKFDEYLKSHGIIFDYTFAETVHMRMDKGTKKFGADHRTIDFYHSEEGIREWLKGMTQNAYQDTLTDYLRVALGHLVLDYIASRFPQLSEEELMSCLSKLHTKRISSKVLQKHRVRLLTKIIRIAA